MPNKIKYLLKTHKYTVIQILLIAILFISNYRPYTWLLGWDSIMPEFNFSATFSKFLFGNWSEFQGLGKNTIYSYSADLPRTFILFLLSFFLTQNFLRWFYTFLMLFIGIYLCFKLIEFLLIDSTKDNSEKVKYTAFFGSLVYLLNIGTIQNYLYTPLSMFTTYFALLPGIFLYLIKMIQTGGRKNYLILSILLIFTTPVFVTTTNFVVFFGFISLFLLSLCLIKKTKIIFKRSLLIILTILIINFYWLGGFIYSTLSSGGSVSDAKINRISSVDAFELNKEMSTFQNTILLKGFWMQNTDLVTEKNSVDLMFLPWIIHFENPLVIFIGFVLFLLSLLGIGSIVVKRKIFTNYYCLLLFILLDVATFILILNVNPPLGFIFNFLREHSVLFKEAFRFPHNKFINFYLVSYSILISYGFYYIVLLVNKLNNKRLNTYLSLVPCILLFFYIWPAFNGNLIYNRMKVDLPPDYQQVGEYFKTISPNTRVALLPYESFWGWYFKSWGDRGSGFITYLLPQSLLDRSFNVWNSYNEEYFTELNYAIFSNNADLLSKVLNKYQIEYIIFDKYSIVPQAPKAAYMEQTQSLLTSMPNIKLEEQYGNIIIYKNTLLNNISKYIYAPKNYKNINGLFKYSNIDSNYLDGLTYIKTENNNTVYPFSDDSPLQSDLNSKLYIEANISSFITIPSLNNKESIPANLNIKNSKVEISYLYPKIKDTMKGGYIFNPEFSEEKALNLSNNRNVAYLYNNEIFDSSNSKNVLIDENSTLTYFNTNPDSEIEFKESYVSSEPVDCGGSVNGSFGKLLQPNGFSLITKHKNICLSLASVTINTPSVLKIEYQYKSDTNSYPLICLDSGNGNCINNKYKNSSTISKNYVSHEEYVVLNNSVSILPTFILENIYNNEEIVDIKDVRITTYPLIGNLSFKPDPKAFNISNQINIDNNKLLEIEFPNIGFIYNSGSPFFNNKAKNCDNFNFVNYNREFLNDANGYYYKYTSTDAISCDRVKTSNLSGNASWLITFNYQNIKGKGLDICIAGTNLDKCMIQDRLQNNPYTKKPIQKENTNSLVQTKNSKQSQSFILPSYPSVDDYAINIGSQSIGREETINNLYSIETKYTPYTWLKGIYLNNQLPLTNYQFTNPIISVDKAFSYKYNVNLNSLPNENLIVLSQSYEDGWGMYDKNNCSFNVVTPFTCKKIGTHVLVNNWSNGWLVPANTTSVAIIFWPQYLQFFGYIVFIFWVGFTSVYVFYTKRLKNASNKFYS